MPSGNAHMYRQLNGRRLLTGMVLAILTLGLIVIDLGMGSSGIGPGEVVDALLGGPDGDTANTAILWSIRLPMTLTCVFVGGSLSLAGLQIQTITNNALASPYTLGITASASFGAAIAITLGLSVAGYLWIGTALLALVFALAVSLLIFYLGRLKGMSTSTLILSGIIMNFFFQALQQYLQYRASPEIAQIISGWTFGNLQRSSWMSVVVSGCLLVMGAALLSGWSWRLTVLTTGEERARSLGINVERLRLHVFLICSFLIAGAVGRACRSALCEAHVRRGSAVSASQRDDPWRPYAACVLDCFKAAFWRLHAPGGHYHVHCRRSVFVRFAHEKREVTC